MCFSYEKFHLHDNVYHKNNIDTELAKKLDGGDVDKKSTTSIMTSFIVCFTNKLKIKKYYSIL